MTIRRSLVCFALLLWFSAETANASTLHLPREFAVSEMGTIGVAFVNPTLTTATGSFSWRSAQGGVTLATTSRTIPAKGQMALTLNQLFPGVTASGWLAVTLDVDQVTGFWIGGDFSTSADGAPLLSTTNAVAGAVFTAISSSTEISFANLETTTLTGNLLLRDASGAFITSVPFSVPGMGLYQAPLNQVFPNQAGSFDSAGYRVSVSPARNTAKVIGTSVTPRPGLDNVVTNLVYATYTRLLAPHVVAGPVGAALYTSLVTITSYLSTGPTTVTLTLRQSSGSPLTVQQTIPPNGVLRATVESLFGLSSLDGWLLVEGGSGASMSGMLTYTDAVSGGTTAVEMQGHNGDTGLIFGHIADLSPWLTGIALANTSTSNAQVEVYALDPLGNLIGGPAESASASFTLAANSKRAFLLGDVVPRTRTRGSDGGYVYIKSTNAIPLFGIELFFLQSGRVYANVPATRMTNLGFTPPSLNGVVNPPVTGGVQVESLFFGDANRVPITSFQACNTVTLNMIINNTTGRVVGATRQYRVVSPDGSTLYMFSVAGDQTAGRESRFSNLAVPCTAISGTYTFSASVDFNGIISASSSNAAGQGGVPNPNPPPPPPPPPQNCDSSTGAICVPGNDYGGTPILSLTACYDTYTRTSKVNAIALLATGGAPLSGYTWTLAAGSTFPPGTTVVPETGIFKSSGSPLVPSNFPYGFTMQVSDGSLAGTGTYQLTVDTESSAPTDLGGGLIIPGVACPSAVFQQPDRLGARIVLPAATQGRGYGASLEVILGPHISSLSWSLLSGELPPGMAIDQARGIVRGTPFSSAAGREYRFRVNVSGLDATTSTRINANTGGFGAPEYSITVR